MEMSRSANFLSKLDSDLAVQLSFELALLCLCPCSLRAIAFISDSLMVTSRRMLVANFALSLSKSSLRGVIRSPPMSMAPGLTRHCAFPSSE